MRAAVVVTFVLALSGWRAAELPLRSTSIREATPMRRATTDSSIREASPLGGATTSTSGPTRHIVRMQGGRFAPYELTIAPGDTVRFVLGAGGPHNVAFRETTGDAAAALRRQMRDTIADLAGPLLIVPGESYDVVFATVPAGTYPYWCIPHLAMGQMGSITVR